MPDVRTGTEAGLSTQEEQTEPGTDTGHEQLSGTQSQGGPQAMTEQSKRRVYTDADMAAARREAEQKRKEAERRARELEERLARYEAEEREREEASLSELERAKREAEEAKAARIKAEEAAEAARVKALRADMIARYAATLPEAYKAQVTGDDEEMVLASIEAAKAAWAEQQRALRQALISELARMTPDQIAQEFGEEGKALAERMTPQPLSIGAPSAAQGQLPVPPGGRAAITDRLAALVGKGASISPLERSRQWAKALTGRE